jgi:hypothetical protein
MRVAACPPIIMARALALPPVMAGVIDAQAADAEDTELGINDRALLSGPGH